jgi:glutamate/tyrosine decarboxylase-like PLP-dependent enzyme
MNLTPQSSQRARGAEVWAALAFLGRDGLAELVDRTAGWRAASPPGWPRPAMTC